LGYTASILAGIALLAVSFVSEVMFGIEMPIVAWPLNFVSLFLLAAASYLVYKFSAKSRLLAWFSSLHASVASILMFVSLTLIMALVPQHGSRQPFLIFNVSSSIAYAASLIFLLVTLGAVIFKRFSIKPLSNIGFTLNHAGLWICLAAAHLGSSDAKTLSMSLSVGKAAVTAADSYGSKHDFGFAIKLESFNIEEFPAKIAVVHNQTGLIAKIHNRNMVVDAAHAAGFMFNSAKYIIIQHFYSSSPASVGFIEDTSSMAVQSVQIARTYNGAKDTFWVSAPSAVYQQTIAPAGDGFYITMLEPEPKRYISELSIHKPQVAAISGCVSVNNPLSAGGWKIYQHGFERASGQNPARITLQLVRDPWLPFVYAGLFMMLAGSVYLIFTGTKKEEA
jgi:hypothetical protein